ncbi:amidase, partial [bacterium]|nr:amidase [bacterium]
MNEWAFQSATDLANAIKNKKISSADLLEIYIERTNRLNPKINAIITTDFDTARKKAKKADKALEAGENWGPLHGLPITIKDNLEVIGMPCTAGSPDLKDYVPSRNADVVQALLDAGAIVFGKTNLPLFGNDFQTYNKIHGQTNNPWNVNRTPGGSSGGSAAAISAGLTALEIGNDIGGSIRHPANFCGIYGHKPTHGIVPDRGIIPPLPGIFTGEYTVNVDITVNGPLARSPEDLDLIMGLITRPERPDRKAWKIKLPPPRRKTLKEYRIALWLDDPACPVDIRVSERIKRVADALATAGAKVEEKKPDISFSRSFEIFTSLLNGILGQSAPENIFNKWIASEPGLPQETSEYKSSQIRGAIQRHRNWLMVDAERQIMRQKWADFFTDFDILLCPTSPTTAFPHDHGSWFERTINVNGSDLPYSNILGWAGLTNVVLLPSTIAPMGLSSNGLPVGVQIVAPYLEDRTSIHL